MEFYYLKLLEYLLKQKKTKAAERLLRLIEILNVFAYIQKILYSPVERRECSQQDDLSYHVENFYMRVYIFRETFNLFINSVFELGLKEGDKEFRKLLKKKIEENKKIHFLLDAIEELKNDKAIKDCLNNWRGIEHQAVKGIDFSDRVALIEALGRKKMSQEEKIKLAKNIANHLNNNMQKVELFLTGFLEKYCKSVYNSKQI